MTDDIAIKVENVSKTFKLPHEKVSSIKSAVINFYRRNRTYEKQQVLKDVSLEIKKGEFFGVVGRNGSGKSTLLKLLAGIYTPDQGGIHTHGQLTPFIELGVGFNPELTGRENVFLNGALLGFSRSEMNALYKDIVKFAELEKFMDQKLKNYSSGMQVRLAFSIAIQVKSDILVLDEVLAVGDEAFQRKCIKVFDSYKKNKQTVILVTHDMETVKKYCTRAILLHEGEIIEEGNPFEVATRYSKLNQTSTQTEKSGSKNSAEIDLAVNKEFYGFGEKMTVNVAWPSHKKVDTVGVAIYTSTGECVYATNTAIDKVPLKQLNSITYSVDLEIGKGNYFIMAGTFAGKDNEIVDFVSEGPSFSMLADRDVIKGEGTSRLKHSWSLKNHAK